MDNKENAYIKLDKENSYNEPSTNEVFSFNIWLLIFILHCKFHFIKLSHLCTDNTYS